MFQTTNQQSSSIWRFPQSTGEPQIIQLCPMVEHLHIINGNSRILKWRYLHVPTIYKAYVSGLNFRGYTPKIWPEIWYNTLQYLHFRILEFPLIICNATIC